MKTIFLLLGLTVATALAADSAALIKKGDELDKQFKTPEALAVFLEADKAQPNNAEVLYRIAREYGLSMNDVSSKSEKVTFGKKALEAAKRAVEADPRNANAQLALAISYGRLALLSDNKTKIEYSKLIHKHALVASELDPKNDLAWHVLGAWTHGIAELKGLTRSIATMIYGELPKATNEEAVEYFQKAIALNPERVGNYLELGHTYVSMGEKAKAKSAFEKGLSLPNQEKDDAEAKARARVTLKQL